MAAARGAGEAQTKPNVGDILLVIHDFQARSSDELTLAKGDRVELIERDDEFGDGWFLGKHMVNGNSGLFPEVYTRPAPKSIPGVPNNAQSPTRHPLLASLPEGKSAEITEASQTSEGTVVPPFLNDVPVSSPPSSTLPIPEPLDTGMVNATLPLSSFKSPSPISHSPISPTPVSAPGTTTMTPTSAIFSKSLGASASASMSNIVRPAKDSQDSQVLHETLNVIDEHITDLRSPPSNGTMLINATDSGSEYSSHLDQRMSYIQGEETDEEEDGMHSRSEVESWSADQVAEYLFTAGVEKHHCEVFRDQEITGEVILGMDQTSLFIKAFDLGSVGRRLKTWQRIKALQDEVNGLGQSTRRNTGTYGSDVGSDDIRRPGSAAAVRSRTNTLTNSVQKLPPIDDRPVSVHAKRLSATQTPRMDPTHAASPVSPISPRGPLDSPTRALHEKRPSAASVRDLHHSRRHSSSTDFRLTGTTLNNSHHPGGGAGGGGGGGGIVPKLHASGTFPQTTDARHKKEPSFDMNWTLGSATAYAAQRPLSSAGFEDVLAGGDGGHGAVGDSAVDLDRGYFSGTEADGRTKRNTLMKKRESLQQQAHARNTSYAEEQRVRSATALSRHSRFGSADSAREPPVPLSPAAQKYYGLSSSLSGSHRRTTSSNTADSVRPSLPPKDAPSPTVTKLDGSALENPRASPMSPMSPMSPAARQGSMHSSLHHPAEWLSKPGFRAAGLGLRAISDAVTGHERSKMAGSPAESLSRDSPMQSPSRTGSSTPSGGPSFELDSPDAKSPSTMATAASARSARKKTKKETSAYQRGLQKMSPREAMLDADYSGWMKKKSSNLMTTWKPRLFVLKGRRLAYYYSEDDDQEKGLIDISFHRVLPADNERLTGLHATLTGASTTPTMPAGSHVPTLAETEADADKTMASDSMFIFKLVPPRAGLSRAVNFTKPMVHYFAVPNIKQGRLWMAALMKATIDRDDTTPVTSTYQQKTISLAKARQMRHRPPALMNLDEKLEGGMGGADDDDAEDAAGEANGGALSSGDILSEKREEAGLLLTSNMNKKGGGKMGGLGIVYSENDSGVAGLEKFGGVHKVESAKGVGGGGGRLLFAFDEKDAGKMPVSA